MKQTLKMGTEKALDAPSKPPVDERRADYDTEATIPRGRAAWFGGPGVKIGPRIAPLLVPVGAPGESDSDINSDEILLKQRESEQNSAIQYRTCSWQKVRPMEKTLGDAAQTAAKKPVAPANMVCDE